MMFLNGEVKKYNLYINCLELLTVDPEKPQAPEAEDSGPSSFPIY